MSELERSTAISPEPVDGDLLHKQALLGELGITAKSHIAYEWNGYRYTNAADAIAAAKRVGR
jgi:hypothetical protein